MWERVKAAFAEASLAAVSAREEIIRRHCGGDEAARAEVERMLAHAGSPEAVDSTSDPLLDDSVDARRIGPYEVVGLIGAGASSIVYRARDSASGRGLAVKVLRLAVASEKACRRLEYEGEVLAGLDHPGIARVFEIGSTQTEFGTLPYIAMELVVGKPIDVYAEEHDLNDRARIALFARVCDAMAFAHRRGVIHRDLKPANILVDPLGRVKVLDFGIARSMIGDLHATTLSTHSGDVLGTPGYMSPEQCAGQSASADTRSDVYALGVVLFELLSRERLFQVGDLPVLAALDVIRRAEPPLIGSARRELRGPIEDVIARAMRRDPRRRYEAAGALANDLRRLLRGEPVYADPVSTAFRLRRSMRRHRSVVFVSSAIITGLIVLLGLFWLDRALYTRTMRDRADVLKFDIVTAGAREPAERYLTQLLEILPEARYSIEDRRALFDRVGTSFMGFDAPEIAADMYERGLADTASMLGREHEQSIRSLQIYVEALAMAGHPRQAELLAAGELDYWGFWPEVLPPRADTRQHQRLLRLAMTRGEAIGRQGRQPEAVGYLSRVLMAQRTLLPLEPDGAPHTDILETERLIGEFGGGPAPSSGEE